jgi:hypothetical protein
MSVIETTMTHGIVRLSYDVVKSVGSAMQRQVHILSFCAYDVRGTIAS